MSKPYYAVKVGRAPGIYSSWEDCQREVIGFPSAVFKKFKSLDEARQFLNDSSINASVSSTGDKNTAPDTRNNEASHPASQEDALAYVDGSFNSKKGIYGYGVLLILGSGERKSFQGSGEDPHLASMRNVAGEIHGAMRAVEEAEALGVKSLTIFYDYSGIECWANGSWKRNREGTKAYYEFMQKKMRSLNLHFQKVKAHSGVEYNELVDRLAKDSVGIG